MDAERTPGATFALSTSAGSTSRPKRQSDIKTAGAYRYATEADAIVLAYAIGAGPVNTVAVTAFDGPSTGRPAGRAYRPSRQGNGRRGHLGGLERRLRPRRLELRHDQFPEITPWHIIDVMAQATPRGCRRIWPRPRASIGTSARSTSGKDLIKLFCLPDEQGDARRRHPAEWAAIPASTPAATSRRCARCSCTPASCRWPSGASTGPMEAINDRGVGIDVRWRRAPPRSPRRTRCAPAPS